MSTQKNLITLCFATVFTLGLAACGGGGDGDAPVTGLPDMDGSLEGKYIPSGTTIPGVDAPNVTLTAASGESVELAGLGTVECASDDGCSGTVADGVLTITGDLKIVSVDPALDSETATVLAGLAVDMLPEPTELEKAQTAAMEATTDAMTAAGNADTAATAAETARADAATLQTGETSGGLAEKARTYAGAAHAAYMYAKAASEDAADAEDITAAVRAQVDAENARDAAQAAETKAGEYSQASMDAADAELMIDGTGKRVGGTSLDATAGSSVVTTDGQTVETGLIEDMNPEHMVVASTGDAGMAGDSDAPTDPYEAPTAGAAARTFDIGKVVDSPDDMARLMIVTQYAGSKTVKVFANGGADDLEGRLGSDGRIQTMGAGDEDLTNDVFVSLKAVGMYYLAGTDGSLDDADVVGADAEATQVYSYDVDGTKTYAVYKSSTKLASGITNVVYSNVDIHVALDRDTSDADNSLDHEVTAKIPEATGYKHIHFGAWAALGDAEEDGSQVPAALGIGFVQSIGDGLSGADMPNNGGAMYSGNWIAAVREKDEDGNGEIFLESGAASLEADFDEDDITATLDGLATLSGDISGNTFLGDEASDITHLRLDAEGEFTGSFSGGFYGAKAAEAGGVFAFTSEDQEAGEFSGAFGADRK